MGVTDPRTHRPEDPPISTPTFRPASSPAEALHLAGPGGRLGARLLDGLIVAGLALVSFGFWVGVREVGSNLADQVIASNGPGTSTGTFHGVHAVVASSASTGTSTLETMVYLLLLVGTVSVLVLGRRGGTALQTARVLAWPVALWSAVLLTSELVDAGYRIGLGDLWATIVPAYAVAFFYAPVLLSRTGAHNGQTLAKQWLGLRVVRDDGGPVSVGRAVVREPVGTVLLSVVPLYSLIDGLMVPLDRRRRALHDHIASTLVTVADTGPAPFPAAAGRAASLGTAAAAASGSVAGAPDLAPGAGWYADPGDPSRHRWWNGTAWTEHVG